MQNTPTLSLAAQLRINFSQMLDRARVVGEIYARICDARFRCVVAKVLSMWKTVQIKERLAVVRLQSLVRGRRGRLVKQDLNHVLCDMIRRQHRG